MPLESGPEDLWRDTANYSLIGISGRVALRKEHRRHDEVNDILMAGGS
jgi:hypothetical protein